jgi:uncharacterized protein YndB with AHSA1/START domain
VATITVTAEIEVPIEDLFAYVADARNDPAWCASVLECRQVRGDGPELGSRYEAVHKPGPKASTLAIEVVEYEPPRRIAWTQEDDAGTFEVAYDLEDLGPGRTRITQTDVTAFRGPFRLLSPVLHALVRRTLPRQFASLREVLESAAAR